MFRKMIEISEPTEHPVVYSTAPKRGEEREANDDEFLTG
jgi:hypothetical protein